jgi:hypothetical protein
MKGLASCLQMMYRQHAATCRGMMGRDAGSSSSNVQATDGVRIAILTVCV